MLLVVLAVLALSTAGFALKHTTQPAPYNGPQAQPFHEDHQVYPQVAFIGDSYTAGSDVGGRGVAGWPALLTAKHRWSPHVVAAGGSGYVVGGTASLPFAAQLPNAVAVKPQLLIVWASRNDIPKGVPAIGEAAGSLFADIKHQLPATKVVVIGPAWINSEVPAVFYAARDAERTAAQRAGFPFVDPLAEGWFSGQAANFIGGGTDKVHPTSEGHRYLAGLIDNDLRRLGVAKLPTPPQTIG